MIYKSNCIQQENFKKMEELTAELTEKYKAKFDAALASVTGGGLPPVGQDGPGQGEDGRVEGPGTERHQGAAGQNRHGGGGSFGCGEYNHRGVSGSAYYNYYGYYNGYVNQQHQQQQASDGYSGSRQPAERYVTNVIDLLRK